jgi:hypothetical protein
MSNKEIPRLPSKDVVKKKLGERLEPEEAFLAIPLSLRAAMKKHLPWVSVSSVILFKSVIKIEDRWIYCIPKKPFSAFKRMKGWWSLHECSFFQHKKNIRLILQLKGVIVQHGCPTCTIPLQLVV